MKIISFYLPQFHPIPENDRWWGAGFTDWDNVRKARPRFRGHRQPHVPVELGYYDPRDPKIRSAQATLARDHGLGGFCYYHYWFNGRLLLEQPFDQVLETREPDFPFCLCWANENWTRRWDGRDRDVLLAQDYKTYDAAQHMRWLDRAFRDPRYILVDGRPLFLIYNPAHIPQVGRLVDSIRIAARAEGQKGLHLVAVTSYNNTMTAESTAGAGFDALVEFYPNQRNHGRPLPLDRLRTFLPRLWNLFFETLRLDDLVPAFPVTRRFSYSSLVEEAMRVDEGPLPTYPCVMPSWDNCARRRIDAMVIENDDPGLYGRWLTHAMKRVSVHGPDQQLVFVNAWNEWAEGCHLEPDRQFGRSFLEATREMAQTLPRAGSATITGSGRQR